MARSGRLESSPPKRFGIVEASRIVVGPTNCMVTGK